MERGEVELRRKGYAYEGRPTDSGGSEQRLYQAQNSEQGESKRVTGDQGGRGELGGSRVQMGANGMTPGREANDWAGGD